MQVGLLGIYHHSNCVYKKINGKNRSINNIPCVYNYFVGLELYAESLEIVVSNNRAFLST